MRISDFNWLIGLVIVWVIFLIIWGEDGENDIKVY